MENTLKNSEQAPSLEKMEALKKFLDSRIMGQDKILSPLCDCLKFGMLNLNTPGRPRGTLFLLGSHRCRQDRIHPFRSRVYVWYC